MKLEELKQQVEELRKQQETLVNEVGELVQTFRSLATHMGMVSDAYKPGSKKTNAPPAGFA